MDETPNRRSGGRVLVEHLTAHTRHGRLGTVLDLSSGGLRVARVGGIAPKAGQLVMLELRWLDVRLVVPAVVVWVRRVGYLRHRMGLSFDKPSETMREQISHLAYVARTAVLSARVIHEHDRS